MKTLSLIITLLISITSFAQKNEGQTITVTVDNVLNNNGKVILSLHTAETFMKGAGIKNKESSIEDGKVTVTFKDIQPGTYAIMALHDENDNNRMDFEVNGMPKESYGTSKNPMSFGPPQFSESKFEVTNKNLKLNIRF